MGFDLSVAVKPAREYSQTEGPAGGATTHRTIISLNGTLDGEAGHAVIASIRTAHENVTDSILVAMEDVHIGAGFEGNTFAHTLMELRAAGVDVQCSTEGKALYDALAESAHSRDWLIRCEDEPRDGPRRAVHVDGPSLHPPKP